MNKELSNRRQLAVMRRTIASEIRRLKNIVRYEQSMGAYATHLHENGAIVGHRPDPTFVTLRDAQELRFLRQLYNADVKALDKHVESNNSANQRRDKARELYRKRTRDLRMEKREDEVKKRLKEEAKAATAAAVTKTPTTEVA